MKVALGAGALLVASVFGMGFTTVSAAPGGVDLRSSAPAPVVEQVQSARTCRRLRRDCIRRDGIGDRADCRRYRRVCERWWR
ncbi:MAG: hypothetical protein HC868_00410 [Sphingomonadales bacterium]|nr:hypothetical protein [Sphingomonadales bacterium]